MGKIVIPYTPREQFEPFHERQQRFTKVVAHRRFGKTVGCINDLIRAAVTNTRKQPPPRYAYIAPTYTQAKDVAWNYLKYYSAPIPGVKFSESELWAEYPNAARIRLYGADNYERLRGLYLDGAVIDEPAQIDPRAWPEVIRPTLADHAGWATFIGTPAGRDWFYKIDRDDKGEELPGWFRLTLKASETGIINPDELESLKVGLSDEQYAQEFECSFEAAVVGAYYGRIMQEAEGAGRIAGVPYEPTAEVWTAWDLGIRDATAIWFCQTVGKEIRLIDYYEATGADLGHYVNQLRQRPYVYGGHIVPHDAQAKELGTGKSRLEVLESLGLNNITVAPMHRVEDGINAVRVFLPKCWIDKSKCARGIDALKLYRAEYDDKLQTLKPRPVHDWCFTGETEVLTRYGTHPISSLPYQGEVLTPCGWKPYLNPRVTRRSAPLVEVRFTDGLSVRCTPDHLFLTADGWKSAEHLRPGTLIQSSLTTLRSISMAAFTGFGRAKDTIRGAARNFIATLGNWLSGQFPRAATFTIETETRQTTCLQISNASPLASTFRSRGRIIERSEPRTGISLFGRSKPPRIGTGQRPEGFGTGAMHNGKRLGQNGSGKKNLANIAASLLARSLEKAGIVKSFARSIAKPLLIESVARLQSTEDVWCITVPGEEAFSLANGAIVHNCSHGADALRYLAMSYDTWTGRRVELPEIEHDWVV